MQHLRRSITQFVLRACLSSTAILPNAAIKRLAASGVAMMSLLWPVRRRLRANLELALGEQVPPDAVGQYFRRMGVWAGAMMRVYHRGLAGSQIPNHVFFDDSLKHLDEAHQRGRGVVLATAHMFNHEIGGAIINLKHPVTALVREQHDGRRAAMKERWYNALGVQTIWRPRKSTVEADTMECLRVLSDGKVLGITPDLPVETDKGVAVKLFGRTVRLMPGAVALAMYGRAPMVSVWPRWINRWDCVLRFDPPIIYPTAGDRQATMQQGMQAWCDRFEAHLREHPEDWLFWLDKRWTRLLRETPRDGAAA